jgi:rubredoxin
MTHVSSSKVDRIQCPFCNKTFIDIIITPEYYSYTTSRISAKSKKIPSYHPERIEIHSKCPNCGASKAEIKEAFERGQTKQVTHEDRLKRMHEAGLPTRIEG